VYFPPASRISDLTTTEYWTARRLNLYRRMTGYWKGGGLDIGREDDNIGQEDDRILGKRMAQHDIGPEDE
jgi:hypothetical protein